MAVAAPAKVSELATRRWALFTALDVLIGRKEPKTVDARLSTALAAADALADTSENGDYYRYKACQLAIEDDLEPLVVKLVTSCTSTGEGLLEMGRMLCSRALRLRALKCASYLMPKFPVKSAGLHYCSLSGCLRDGDVEMAGYFLRAGDRLSTVSCFFDLPRRSLTYYLANVTLPEKQLLTLYESVLQNGSWLSFCTLRPMISDEAHDKAVSNVLLSRSIHSIIATDLCMQGDHPPEEKAELERCMRIPPAITDDEDVDHLV